MNIKKIAWLLLCFVSTVSLSSQKISFTCLPLELKYKIFEYVCWPNDLKKKTHTIQSFETISCLMRLSKKYKKLINNSSLFLFPSYGLVQEVKKIMFPYKSKIWKLLKNADARLDKKMKFEYYIGGPTDGYPLNWAAQTGRFFLSQELLRRGAASNSVDCIWNITPLHLAIRGHHFNIVTLLLAYKADVNIHSEFGYPLFIAVENWDESYGEKLIRLLLFYGADINAFSMSIGSPETALEKAIYGQRYDLVKLLVRLGANIHLKNQNLFYASCAVGDVQICKFLIKKGIDVYAPDKSSCPPFMIAIIMGKIAVVKYLYSKGIDIYKGTMNPFFQAVYGRKLDIARFLLECGVHVDSRCKGTKTQGDTSLLWAIKWKRFKRVRWLLNYGASIHKKDKYGKSAMHYAAKNPRMWKLVLNAYLKERHGIIKKNSSKKRKRIIFK